MKQRGFTLLEVMVALAVFAVSAMAILSSTGQNINSLGSLEKKTLASMIVDNQLAIMTLNGAPNVEQNGSTEMAGDKWYWTIRPEPTTNGLLKAVDIIVWGDEKKRSPLVSVRTYVLPNQ